jgi:hypothetical protein
VSASGAELFREEQRFAWPWSALIVVPVAAVWWTFLRQILQEHPVGDDPAPDLAVWLLWLVVGVGVPALFLFHRMITTVTADTVTIRWRPITTRRIPIAEIEAATVREYRPLREYGGWGVRGLARSRKMAYNVSGNRGVELTLVDGRRVMIGSQQPERLADAMRSAAGPQLLSNLSA